MNNEDSSIDLRPFLRCVPTAPLKVDSFPEGFQCVLPFLDLLSRLNVERVNKASKEALKDPFLWVDLMIKCKFNLHEARNLTNENLLKLAERADGHLKSLFLECAFKITDEALSRISELNPGLERISLARCWRLNDENVVSLVEAHSLSARAKGLPGIREVHLTGLCDDLRYHDHLVRRLVTALGFSDVPHNEGSLSGHSYRSHQGHSEDTEERPVYAELCQRCICDTWRCDCLDWLKGNGFIDENKYVNDLEEDEYYIHLYRSCRARTYRFSVRCKKSATHLSISTSDYDDDVIMYPPS